MINNIVAALQAFSVKMSEIVKGIDLSMISDLLYELIQSIPDNVTETEFYEKVMRLKEPNLNFENTKWILEDYGLDYLENNREITLRPNMNSNLIKYIIDIINSENLKEREKLIILLAHMEPLLYMAMRITRVSRGSIKKEIEENVKENSSISAGSIYKLYIFAITLIVFSNTDNYTERIDKRMPFRNNILHNGIGEYSDKDIKEAYNLLVNYISIIVNYERLTNKEDNCSRE